MGGVGSVMRTFGVPGCRLRAPPLFFQLPSLIRKSPRGVKLEGWVFRLQGPKIALPSKLHVWDLSYPLHTVFLDSRAYERVGRNLWSFRCVSGLMKRMARTSPPTPLSGATPLEWNHVLRPVTSFARPDRDSKHNLVVEYICQSSAFLVGARKAAYNPSRRAWATCRQDRGLKYVAPSFAISPCWKELKISDTGWKITELLTSEVCTASCQ